MAAPPPPPPPHGEAPKTTAGGGSGLPTGKYDIFVIPEHSAGSGFLYLPSLRTNTNSFIAGFASALLMVVLGQSMAPAFQAWWANFQGMGNAGMMLLVIAVGLGAWSLGRQQSTDGPGAGAGADSGFYPGGGSMPGGAGFSSAGSTPRSAHSGSTPNGGTHSQAPPGGSQPSANKQNGSYQRPPQSHPEPQPEPQPQAYARPQPETKPEPTPQPPPPPPPQPSAAKPQPETPKSAWEKARDEVRRTEEERKAKLAEDKRRADAAARLKELREKEAKERAAREAEKQRREAEDKEKKDKEAKEARAKELRERLVREREDRRKKLEEEKKLRKEQEENESRKSSSYAYSGVGEKTNPWPAGKPTTASPQAGNPTRSPSPNKKPPAPTARTATEEETYSYRPYDQPKRPNASSRMSNSDMQSESSWAPSQSTARTTPPASVRGAYTTKDPDKIVIKAVYCFMNQYAKTPASQLISGVGSVTDGLILRITTEGMFIDDDVRGVAQREWDVKAWTLKNVEVWCPVHFLDCAIAANSPPTPGSTPCASAKPPSTAFFAKTMGGMARLRAAERGASKTLTGGDADTYLSKMLACCKGSCRLGDCASAFGGTNDDASSVASGSTRTNSTVQTGDWKAKGLHLLRATIRDMDGKRYMFVIGEEEGWKVAVGLQRLRKGSQVRSLGVAGLSGIDTKNTLEMLGWGG